MPPPKSVLCYHGDDCLKYLPPSPLSSFWATELPRSRTGCILPPLSKKSPGPEVCNVSRRHPIEKRSAALDFLACFACKSTLLVAFLLINPPRERDLERLSQSISTYFLLACPISASRQPRHAPPRTCASEVGCNLYKRFGAPPYVSVSCHARTLPKRTRNPASFPCLFNEFK